MTFPKEKVVTSGRGYGVLREIFRQDNPTPSSVSDEFDCTTNAIRRYSKTLEDMNFIVFEKEGRKKIYEVNLDAIYEYWQGKISDLVSGGPMPGVNQSGAQNMGIEDHELASKMSDISTSLQKASEDDIFFDLGFMSSYFEDYFTDNEKSTIENFLIHDFVEGLRRARFTYLDNPFEGIDSDTLEDWEIELVLSSFIIELNYLEEYEPDRSDSLLDTLLDYEKEEGRELVKRRFRENWR